MKLKHVLIVYKKSSYQVYAKERKDRRFIQLIRRGHHVTQRFLPSHESHADALEKVKGIFQHRGIRIRTVYRAHSFREVDADLVVTVGGDGTFLEASHRVTHCPMLGVNSSPRDSVGMFCGATIKTLSRMLDEIEADELPKIEMTRLRVCIGKDELPIPVLNDILISHTNPAATSRYVLHVRCKKEEQKSSGIWIAPPAGSTAAIRGAVGKLLPLRSRQFQFVVREPYAPPEKKVKIVCGILNANETLAVDSKMRNGAIYLDGAHHLFRLQVGEQATVHADAPRLTVLGYNEARRKAYTKS